MNSDIINNTRNYSKNYIWVIQSRVVLTEVAKTKDDIDRVILSFLWGVMNWKYLQVNWWLVEFNDVELRTGHIIFILISMYL